MGLLKFTFENAKLKGIWHYSLPSGHTCPGAKSCLTFAHRETGKRRWTARRSAATLQWMRLDGPTYARHVGITLIC